MPSEASDRRSEVGNQPAGIEDQPFTSLLGQIYPATNFGAIEHITTRYVAKGVTLYPSIYSPKSETTLAEAALTPPNGQPQYSLPGYQEITSPNSLPQDYTINETRGGRD